MSKLFKFSFTPLFVLLFINIYGQVPTISSFSPTSGNVGTTVTITGTNFSTTLSSNVVYFGAVKATVSAATSTSLTVTVPARSTYEPISIVNTVSGRIAQSKIPFRVTNTSISSFPVGSGSFVAPINVTAAAGASNWYEIGDMISVADYDGDGKPDIAKGSNTTSVNVLRNVVASSGSIATNSFSSAGNFTTGSASFEIASGDIDGDGKLDIVSIGTSNFSILRNTSTSGTISFATKVDVTASYQYRVKLADVDGDGRLDVITSSNYSSNFNVYLNTSSIGSISFNTTPTSIGGLNGSRHITIGDINMDGKTDVIAANEGTMNALLFLNTSTTGSVSFGSGIAVAGGYWYNSVGDFDGDDKNDILSNGGNVSLLRNNYSSGTFTSSNLTTASNISSSDGLSYTTQSDFNGDGKLDYFTSFQNSGQSISWYKNNYTTGSFSSSSFAAFSNSFSTPYQMIICDFDGDGKQDIVSSASSNAFVQIARNKIGEDPTITTTGTLSAFTSCAGINSTNQSFSVAGTNLTANISITAPTGFEISTSSNSGYASSLTLTQTGGAVASTTIYVRTTTAATGNPSGNISLSSTGATTVNVAASATVSAAPTLTGTFSIYNGNTTQLTGSATANASTPWVSSNTAVATVNSSGLVSSVSVGTATITYMNTNSCTVAALITVQAPPISISSFSPTSGAVGTSVTITGVNFNTTAANNIVRLNGVRCTVTSATSTQLVVTIPSRTGYGKFSISNTGINQVAYSNNKFNITPSAPINPISNSQFSVNSLSTTFSTNTSGLPKTHFIGDIDDDGKMDFVYYNSSGDLNVFRNTSSAGAFTSASVTLSTKANSTGWPTYGGGRFFGGDMNGDGKMDFGASNGGYNGGLANINASTSGTINFNASSNIKASDGNYNVTNGQEAFDINGDGKLDIIGFYNTSPAWVYLSQNTSSGSTFSVNTGNTANSYAYSFTTTNLPTVTETFDVDGDGKQDLVYGTSSGLFVMRNTTALGAALSSFSLTNSTIATGLSSVNGIVTADINADGKLDVIITQGSNVSTYINNSTSGTISFASAVTNTLASSAKGVGAGDIDGDGKIDIIVSDNSFTYYIKNTTTASTATYSTPVQIATQSLTDLNVFDADGDGKQDVVGTVGSNLVALRNKNGEDPTINVTGTLSSFVTCAGTASNSQTFTVSAINLTTSATITAPTGYEISTSAGAGYGTTVTLSQTAGSITSTVIYARLSSTATGNPLGNIALTSTGATTVNVAASGTVNALPTISGTLTTTTIGTTQLTGSATANASTPWASSNTSIATISSTGLVTGVAVGTSTITYINTNGCIRTALVTVTVPPPAITTTGTLTNFTKCSGAISNAQTFTVTGQYLTANIAIAALTGFEYSTDGTTYASTLSLAPSSGTISATSIFVRLTAAIATNPSGNIVLSTTGGNTVNLAASGTVNALPTITGNTYLTINGSAQLSGSATANSSTPWQSSNTAVATINSTGLVSAVSLGTSSITYTNANNCSVSVNISVNTPAPIVSSFTPISGNIGSSITITGSDFSSTAANNIVFFGSVRGNVTAASATSLTVTVPAGAKVASIKVINTDNNLSGVSSKSFVPTYTNANPVAIASSHFTAIQMTTATSPASVNSPVWSSVRHNGGVADLDGDGKVDLLMVDNTNSRIAIYKNAATSGSLAITNFSTVVYASSISGPTDIDVEDINNDGKPDIIVANGGTSISILINTSTVGNISFATKQDFTVASSMIVKVADVNEDGRPDIITAARGGSSVNIYSNTTALPSNTITLSTVTSLTGASSIYDIVIKDINNDNKPDINLAASNYYAFINTNSSPSSTSFSQSVSKTTSAGLYSIQVEDYNLDNKNDVVFGFMGAANGGMFQNNYNSGTIANTDFSSEITITNLSGSSSQYAWQLQSGDFNGDGKPDILNTDFNAGSTVRIVTNTNTMGSGNTLSSLNFAGAYIGSSSSYGNSFAVDLDNDGKTDWANFSNNRIDIGRNKTGEDPTITRASNFSNFVTCPSTASPSQTFTVSGTFLTANISVTVPSGYEVSTSANSGYATSLTLTQTNGVVTNTTVYIRLASTASGTPAGNISLSSTGATTQTIAVAGTLNSVPTITGQPSLTAQSRCINVAATPLTVTATGTNITYQWYSNATNSNTGGTLITGANSATYTPSTSTLGTVYYYVVVSGTCTPNATSNVAGAVTTNPIPSVTIGSITSPISTATSFSLPYSGATGSPNQYSISVDANNSMSSFVAVNNATLASSPITVAIPQSIANSYDYNLIVRNSTTGCTSANIPFTVVVAKATPTLTGFTALNKTFGGATFTLTNPTSASTGTFSYTISDPNVATVSGNVVTIVGAGTATITASQTDDNRFNATSISTTLTVAKATPTLSNFGAISKNFGENAFQLTDPTSASTGTFSYTSSNANVVTVNGNTVTIVGAGTATITATQSSDANYSTGSIASTITVAKINPIISNFSDITKNYGDAAFTLTAPNSNAPGSITYSSSNNSVATISGSTLTIIGAGTATITATQAGSNNYNAGTISALLTVNKIDPTLTNFNPINTTFGNAPITITAPSSNSNGSFSYVSSDVNVATINGAVITIVGAGTASITATQAGTNNFNNTNNTISTNITVAKATPTLSGFNSIQKNMGDANFTLTNPTSNSTGNFTFTISDTSIASINGNTVTIIGAGTASITATQAADNNYNARTISTTIVITKPVPTLSNFSTINKTFGDANFTLSSPSSNSTGNFSYVSSNPNIATISGATVSIIGAGTITITATQASDNNYSVGTIATTLTISKANPILSGFNSINKTFGDASFAITPPNSNSNAGITYVSNNTSVATISGTTINIIGAGTATITATQSSNSNFNNGTIATNITVAKANPVLGTFNNISKAIGDPSFAITAPVSNSTGTISYASSNLNVVTITGNIVTVVGAGTATITATQASTNNYNTATATALISVGQTNPTISGFANISKIYGNNPFTLTAPVSNSNGAFSYTSSNSNVATINGNTVTIVGAGTATITATQASSNNYNSGSITAILTVAKANPTIGSLSPINKLVTDADFTINAPSSNSTATFTFTSSNANVATITGNSIRIVGIGNTTITATQASNNNYNGGSTSTVLNVAPAQSSIRIINDSFSTTIDTLFTSNITLNDSAPNVNYGNAIADVSNPAGAIMNVQANGTFTFRASQVGTYKFTISACSSNNQQNCPTSLLVMNATYLPQASINLFYNTLLASDTAKLIANFSNGVAPYSIIIKNNKDTVKQEFTNLTNTANITLAPRKDSAIFAIHSVKDANNVIRYSRFTKDTTQLHIVKPDIKLTLKATPPQPITDSTLQMNLLLSIENKGVVDVNGVQVLADLTKVFPPGMEYILDSVSTADSTILLNPNYTGINTTLRTNSNQGFSVSTVRSNSTVLSQAELFNFGVNLLKQQKGNVNFKFKIKPNAVTTPLVLQFSSSGKGQLIQNDGKVSTTPASTVSTDGANPNPSNTANPIPTYVPLVPINYIGSALEGSMPTIENGGYVFHYNAIIKNYSNGNLDAVKAILDLSNSFSRPDTAFVTYSQPVNASITFNNNYNGYSDKNLFSNIGLLAVGDSIKASFDIHIRTNKLKYTWPISMSASAVTSLYNTPISDESYNGTNPDPNFDKIPAEQSITLSSVGYAAPSSPTVRSLVYSLGNASNPINLSNMIVSTPTGTIPSWCDINGNNCTVIAPNLPIATGRYIWCIKAYDTLSGQYSTNCVLDTVTMLPSLTVRKLTFVKSVTTNPINIASAITAISPGSKVRWCDANGNNCTFTTPSTPVNIGEYIWTVSAVDTTNNLTSAGTIKDTVTILDPYKVIDLTKRISQVAMNPDGSFNVEFNFVVSNNSGQILNDIVLKDNLTNVFGNNVQFTVLSVRNTGYLNVNPKYNGVTDINLVNNNVILLNNKQDTVLLTLLVKGTRIDGNYSNSASATVNTNYGAFTVISNDPISNPNNTNNRLATNFVIPKLDVIVAGGFSPNNDGIDDTWIIERPYGTKIAVRVFNRWGNEVFQSEDYMNDWRGRGERSFLGTEVPGGTYFYAIIVTTNDNKTYKLSGSLTIVK